MRLRTPAAASYLGISPRTLEKWRITGGGPRYRKLGHAVVYDERDLDDFAERGVRTSTSDAGAEPRPAA